MRPGNRIPALSPDMNLAPRRPSLTRRRWRSCDGFKVKNTPMDPPAKLGDRSVRGAWGFSFNARSPPTGILGRPKANCPLRPRPLLSPEDLGATVVLKPDSGGCCTHSEPLVRCKINKLGLCFDWTPKRKAGWNPVFVPAFPFHPRGASIAHAYHRGAWRLDRPITDPFLPAGP